MPGQRAGGRDGREVSAASHHPFTIRAVPAAARAGARSAARPALTGPEPALRLGRVSCDCRGIAAPGKMLEVQPERQRDRGGDLCIGAAGLPGNSFRNSRLDVNSICLLVHLPKILGIQNAFVSKPE